MVCRCYEHLTELETKINSVNAGSVELEDSIFYPGGGGQPCDTGRLKGAVLEAEVVRVWKDDNHVLHELKIISGYPNAGMAVLQTLNLERRTAFTKMHTGEHILFQSIKRIMPEAEVEKVAIGETESTLFIKCSSLSWDILLNAERLANQVVSEDRKVNLQLVCKEETKELEQLRIKIERIKEDKVRVIDIGGFDLSACTGTHAESTGFVKNILITRFIKKGETYQVSFKTDAIQSTLDLAAIARNAAAMLETDTRAVLDHLKQLIAQRESFAQIAQEQALSKLNSMNTEKIGEIDFRWIIVENMDDRLLARKASELCKGKCVMAIANSDRLLLLTSAESGVSARKLLDKISTSLQLKGGGNERFASCQAEDTRKAIDIVRDAL